MRGGHAKCDRCYCTVDRLLLIALHKSSIRRPDIGRESQVFAYPICIRSPRLGESPSGVLPVEKCLFISTEYTNVTDGQTDRHRTHDGIGRAYA